MMNPLVNVAHELHDEPLTSTNSLLSQAQRRGAQGRKRRCMILHNVLEDFAALIQLRDKTHGPGLFR